jgi:hypothetical protein
MNVEKQKGVSSMNKWILKLTDLIFSYSVLFAILLNGLVVVALMSDYGIPTSGLIISSIGVVLICIKSTLYNFNPLRFWYKR